MKALKKLGDAEFEIMKVLWSRSEPATSTEILEALSGKMDWKLASLMTALNRLADKDFVECDRSTRTNYYTALVREQDYVTQAGENFLEKLFSNSVQKFVTNLYDNKSITDADIQELKEWINTLEKE